MLKQKQVAVILVSFDGSTSEKNAQFWWKNALTALQIQSKKQKQSINTFSASRSHIVFADWLSLHFTFIFDCQLHAHQCE